MNNYRKKISSLVVIILTGSSSVSLAQSPVSHQETEWEYLSNFSDEFNTGVLDAKWNNDVKDWGTWSWEPENSKVKDTVLAIQLQHSPHSRNGKDFYFTSGIARTEETITYGYFEASIRAQDTWPSGAPAFWLYSVGQPTPTEEEGVQYSEIDVVEIFQIVNSLNDIEMNLHARIIKNGELTWIRPGQGHQEITRNNWEATWDPRDEFHTYGALSRKDSIFWYIDGVERGRKANLYWHLPMHVTVSLGLRNPYEKYINGERTIVETPEEPAGFPTEMYCDYVRIWQAQPQIVADKSTYENGTFGQGLPLNFEYTYDAGSGYLVTSTDGLRLSLVEKQADGSVVSEIKTTDPQIFGRAAGKSKVSIDLPENITLTKNLPSGNYYSLVAILESDKEGGTTVTREFTGFEILAATDVLSAAEGEQDWIIYPNPVSDEISLKGNFSTKTKVKIFNLSGVQLIQNELSATNASLDVSSLPHGIYILKIIQEDRVRTLKFSK